MIILNIGTLAALLVCTWSGGFICGILYRKRCQKKAETEATTP